MSYFVVMPDGQKFGPADLAILNQWAGEGRILPDTTIEDATTGHRFMASALAGLQLAYARPASQPFPPPGAVQPPTQYAAYQRGPAYVGDIGQSDLTYAWVFGATGLLLTFACGCAGPCALIAVVFPILGIVFANKAAAKGNTGAAGARILSIVALTLHAAAIILYIAAMVFMR
jgi:hypothetical protein